MTDFQIIVATWSAGLLTGCVIAATHIVLDAIRG